METPSPPPGAQISDDQVRDAATAMLEVLSGADQQRVLALMERLIMGKLILQALATGNVVLRAPPNPPAPADTAPSRDQGESSRKGSPAPGPSVASAKRKAQS